MIDCLADYIGLKGVSDEPISGIYINDLHGITTGQFETIREIEENDGIEESWEALENRAIRSFETDIRSNLKKYFKNHQTISSGLTGYVDDNTLADHGSGVYSGWLFDMTSYSSSLKLGVNDVRLTLATAEDFNIKIFDANTGEELYTKAVVGIVGVNIIKILQEFAVYNHNKIFVAYDTIIPIRIFNDPLVPGAISQGSISIGSAVLASSIVSSETGLSVGYNIKCSIEEFVCSRMELFQEAYLYKLGIAFLRESKHSDNWNRYNLLDMEQSNELIAEYLVTYQELLDSTFQDLKVPDDGICFICNKTISKRVLIP